MLFSFVIVCIGVGVVFASKDGNIVKTCAAAPSSTPNGHEWQAHKVRFSSLLALNSSVQLPDDVDHRVPLPVAKNSAVAPDDACRWYSLGHVLSSFIVACFAGCYLCWELLKPVSQLSVLDGGNHNGVDTNVETARTIGCYFALVDSIIFTMVIPDSYDLTKSLGGGATLSGAMIGAHKFGTALGALSFFVLIQYVPNVWRFQTRSTFLVCVVFNLVGTGTYTLIAEAANGRLGDNGLRELLLVGLFMGRIINGCGSGIRLMLTRTHIARLTPADERPAQQARFLFSITLGMGLGPILAAAVKYSDMCSGGLQPRFEPVGLAGVTLSCCQLVSTMFYRPVTEATDLLQQEESAVRNGSLKESDIQWRKRIIWCCLAFSAVRGLCVSGVESATALLLEVNFHWDRMLVGVTIGMAFLTCIPIRILYKSYRTQFTTKRWIQLLLMGSTLGAVLLFRCPQWIHRGNETISAIVLLLGDALLFPCIFLSDGLVQGLIVQHPLPREISRLDLNGVNLLNTLCLDGFARVVGPPLSRFHVAHHGQNIYAAQQLFLTLLASFIAIVGLFPRLAECPLAAKCPSSTPCEGGHGLGIAARESGIGNSPGCYGSLGHSAARTPF